jgi:prepilin-type processing-associated H-X9-DG protein
MKNLKPQMTTAFGLILMALIVAACAPEQTFAKDKGRMRANHINVAMCDGSVEVKKPQTNRKEFDRGYLSPYAANTYTGTTTVNQSRHSNLTVNGGNGNDTFVGRRRNIVGSPEYFNSFNRTRSSLTASTYGRGSFAKARGQRVH